METNFLIAQQCPRSARPCVCVPYSGKLLYKKRLVRFKFLFAEKFLWNFEKEAQKKERGEMRWSRYIFQQFETPRKESRLFERNKIIRRRAIIALDAAAVGRKQATHKSLSNSPRMWM